MSTPEITASFEHLRKTARYLHEIEAWLTKHPQLLAGTMVLPEGATATVDVSTSLAGMEHVEEQNGLLLNVNTKISAPFEPSPFLFKQISHASENNGKRNSQFIISKHSSTITLPLNTWPFAACYVACELLSASRLENTIYEKVIPYVDSKLDIHFPGVTLGKIRSLADAGLLPLTNINGIQRTAVSDFLYNSIKQELSGPSLTLSNDIV